MLSRLQHIVLRAPRLWGFAALALIGGLLLSQAGVAQPREARLINAEAKDAIPGRYIVVMQERGQISAVVKGQPRDREAAARSRELQARVTQLGGKVSFSYSAALTGFAAELPPEALRAVLETPGVAWVEADLKGRLNTIQLNPPNGLDRTSERPLPLDTRFTYSATGAGVNAYVLDTGIRITHNDFGGRAFGVFTAISDGNGTNDCHGHGTHVAGSIGGATFGIAKLVTLNAVRVATCAGGLTSAGVIAGVDWVTANAVHPAVANASFEFAPVSPSINLAFTNSIASGVTYGVAAGNGNTDACNISPASTPTAITVGSVNPVNDTRASDSNFGTCLDLFGPGVGILSAWRTSDTATNTISGTSMATPHVVGVAALILQLDATATPATVLARIHNAANVTGTPGWAGIVDPRPGSPNELLHWGSVGSDGFNDGDPHLKTVDGLRFDFQGAGEYVYLRAPGSWEIQIRQTPVTTVGPLGPDAYHGLSACVSLNTAVAATVGGRRITLQPGVDGNPDPAGLQLRIDGVLTPFPANSASVGGAVIQRVGASGLQIAFPDGTVFVATANWWPGPNLWYLNAQVANTGASEGLMGRRAAGSWLPALPNGASLGAMPASLPQRYAGLYGRYGNGWRVSDRTSLFDYRPGTSTANYTYRDWPGQSGRCTAPRSSAPPPKPLPLKVAKQVCAIVEDRHARANCTADVAVTGERGFAKAYQESERIRLRLAKLPKGPMRTDRPPPEIGKP